MTRKMSLVVVCVSSAVVRSRLLVCSSVNLLRDDQRAARTTKGARYRIKRGAEAP
jgi:hypothetical protein